MEDHRKHGTMLCHGTFQCVLSTSCSTRAGRGSVLRVEEMLSWLSGNRGSGMTSRKDLKPISVAAVRCGPFRVVK